MVTANLLKAKGGCSFSQLLTGIRRSDTISVSLKSTCSETHMLGALIYTIIFDVICDVK